MSSFHWRVFKGCVLKNNTRVSDLEGGLWSVVGPAGVWRGWLGGAMCPGEREWQGEPGGSSGDERR